MHCVSTFFIFHSLLRGLPRIARGIAAEPPAAMKWRRVMERIARRERAQLAKRLAQIKKRFLRKFCTEIKKNAIFGRRL
jgi:hypothetical protein